MDASNFIGLIKDTIFSLTSCCFPTLSLRINGRSFNVVKLLGEGGFSFVYLVQDTSSGRMYALKKIRCPYGSEAVQAAMKEVEAYRQFHHENIIRCIDSCVVSDREGGKIVYIFLPYYKRGNLQDSIAGNIINHNHFPELEMLKLFRGVCCAIRAMHTYTLPSVPITNENEEDPNNAEASLIAGDANASSTHVLEDEVEGQSNGTPGDVIPYAHRDIKPGNVMIADDGITPILMDFGSAVRARIRIDNRQQALIQQDIAAEHSTMPYRAPELFDVKTGTTIDEKVDIWSLGCLLYAMAYGHSPFETSQTEQGGSMALAVLNGQYRFPSSSQDPYSDTTRNLIKGLLLVDPAARPNIHQTIELVDNSISAVSNV